MWAHLKIIHENIKNLQSFFGEYRKEISNVQELWLCCKIDIRIDLSIIKVCNEKLYFLGNGLWKEVALSSQYIQVVIDTCYELNNENNSKIKLIEGK